MLEKYFDKELLVLAQPYLTGQSPFDFSWVSSDLKMFLNNTFLNKTV